MGASWNAALGLPGGLTMDAMWPLVDSTNSQSPPSSDGDLRHVDGGAEHRGRAGSNERVRQSGLDESAVQGGGHAGGVRIPEQHVEGRWLAALQVVVDPVVPDQVVRPEPGEHFRQRASI